MKKIRWIINILTVWFLTGFWHGAAWNFIVWGLYFVVFLAFEKTRVGGALTKTKLLNRIYTLFFIAISFVIFDAVNLNEAFFYIKAMLGFSSLPLITNEFIYYLKDYIVVIVIGLVGSTPLMKLSLNKLSDCKIIKGVLTVMEPVVLVSLLIVVTAYLIDGSFNPFLYFRF